MTKRAIFIHGWGGTPEEGWIPWLKKELEKGEFEVHVPAMPDTDNPKFKLWLKKLTDTVGSPDENCYLIGHSLGCITILRYLESLKEKQKIGGVVLVAGFSNNKINVFEEDGESTDDIKSFFEKNVDFEKIKTHCKKFTAIHSDNDPYVSLNHADIFKEKLNAQIITKHNMQHFSGSEGITELPVALEAVLKMSE